jgi:hypothetical protein
MNEDDDAASEASSSGLPPPLIQGSEYESFVCGSCVSGIHTLKRYAGTPGVMMVVRDDLNSDWKVIGDTSAPHGDNPVEVSDEAVATNAGTKRPRSPSATADANSPESKRARASPGPASSSAAPCLAPSLNIIASKIFTSRAVNDVSLGAGDIFLTEGWRDRWCHCGSVSLIPPICLVFCLIICFDISVVLHLSRDRFFCKKKKRTSLRRTLILVYHLKNLACVHYSAFPVTVRSMGSTLLIICGEYYDLFSVSSLTAIFPGTNLFSTSGLLRRKAKSLARLMSEHSLKRSWKRLDWRGEIAKFTWLFV